MKLLTGVSVAQLAARDVNERLIQLAIGKIAKSIDGREPLRQTNVSATSLDPKGVTEFIEGWINVPDKIHELIPVVSVSARRKADAPARNRTRRLRSVGNVRTLNR